MAEERTRRLGLTLDANEFARARAYARQVGRPVATMAKQLLLAAIDSDDSPSTAAAIIRDRERIKQLEGEVTRLQALLDRGTTAPDLTPDLPRWRWPLDALLADRQWWDEWLPSLGELLGRDAAQDRAYADGDGRLAVDDRGFADLVAHLFPSLGDEVRGQVPWYSPDYGRCARMAGQATDAIPTRRGSHVQAEVWEPVIRHVAIALTALEATSETPNDACAHLRAEAEIRGEWLRTLRGLLGDDTPEYMSDLRHRGAL